MSDFLALLAIYYTCDAMVVHRPLSLTPQELARCMSAYEDVKATFHDTGTLPPSGQPASQADRRAAYAAFKAWEAENETLVFVMRENARVAVLRH